MTQAQVVIKDRQPVYMTPYLPPDAVRIAKNWMREQKMPVFILALDLVNELHCRNCGGAGKIYLKLAKKGPFMSPFPGQVMTWFDGNGQFGKGWYQVEDTMIFECPECNASH